jgi:hypothetical protein
MLNKKFIILFLIQVTLGYNIFNHTQDYKVSSSSYTASYNINNSIYNFFNPACNSDNNQFIYSILGNYFNGILENQQLFFSLNTKILNKINIALLRTSIDDIYDTSSAWNDHNQNNIVDIDEINYNNINTFSHNTLGLILSKPFSINNIRLGINTKFSISSLFDQHSFSHSFDFGAYKKFNNYSIGLVLKDFLNRSYWTEGEINKVASQIIFGSNFNIKSINLSFDYNLFDNTYMLGTNYDYNSLVSFQLAHSTFEKLYLGFLLNFKNFNIGYSFVIPKYTELGISQRILIGINKDFFNLKL